MNLNTAQQRALTWLALGAGLFAMLRLLGAALTPMLVALVLSYLLWPLVRALGRRRVPRAAAAGLTLLGALLAGAVLLLLLVPIVVTQLPLLRAQWPLLLDKLNQSALPWLAEFGVQADSASLKALLLKAFDGNMGPWGERLLTSVRLGGSWLLTVGGLVVLVPVLSFYLLLDAERVGAGAWSLLPQAVRAPLRGFLGECDATLRQYLKGQLAVMGALAVYYSAALSLTGLNLALPIGVFTGLAVFIPYLGFATGLVLGLLSAAIQFTGWHGLLAVGLVYGVGQVLEGFFLTPRLVGGRIGLSPLAVIVALLVFGQLFGFVGVLLALPGSAVAVVALRHGLARYRASAFFAGREPT